MLKRMGKKCLRSLHGCLPVWNVIINKNLQENNVEKRILVWDSYENKICFIDSKGGGAADGYGKTAKQMLYNR